jgi:hypothetical protein
MEDSDTMKARTGRVQLDRRWSKYEDEAERWTHAGYQSDGKHGAAKEELLESILDRANLKEAWRRVRANKGAAGMDGMSIEAFPAFSQANWERIDQQIRRGQYRPAAVRRVWIPKGNGEQRPLGIPTVMDRVIQQAIAQVIAPLFEVRFSEHSYPDLSGPRSPSTCCSEVDPSRRARASRLRGRLRS